MRLFRRLSYKFEPYRRMIIGLLMGAFRWVRRWSPFLAGASS